jgi:prevent-host-death family protein
MEEIGVREFKARASEVLRRVREEGASYAITYRGKVVARLEPEDPEERRRRSEEVWREIDELTDEIARYLPPDVSAVEAIREQRREL